MLSQKSEYGLSTSKVTMTKLTQLHQVGLGCGVVSCHMLGSSDITTELTRLKSLNTE